MMCTKKKVSIQVFDSFEKENAAEHKRLAMLLPEERMKEFTILQKRIWGEKWPNFEMEKVITWETVNW